MILSLENSDVKITSFLHLLLPPSLPCHQPVIKPLENAGSKITFPSSSVWPSTSSS